MTLDSIRHYAEYTEMLARGQSEPLLDDRVEPEQSIVWLKGKLTERKKEYLERSGYVQYGVEEYCEPGQMLHNGILIPLKKEDVIKVETTVGETYLEKGYSRVVLTEAGERGKVAVWVKRDEKDLDDLVILDSKEL